MKNKALFISSAVVAAVLCSCGGNGKTEETGASSDKTVRLETYSYDIITERTDSDTLGLESPGAQYVRCIGTGVLPVEISGVDIKSLRDTLENLAGVTFASPGHASPVVGDAQKVTSLDPSATDACGYVNNMLSVVLTTPRLIVWRVDGSYYNCGAAHGMYSTSFVNYSLDTHRILEIGDLMEPGYEPKLTALLRDKLRDNNDLIVPLDSIGIPSTFRITAYGLRFIYGLYEIAPYSAGEIVVDIDALDLNGILTEKAMSFIVGTPALE